MPKGVKYWTILGCWLALFIPTMLLIRYGASHFAHWLVYDMLSKDARIAIFPVLVIGLICGFAYNVRQAIRATRRDRR